MGRRRLRQLSAVENLEGLGRLETGSVGLAYLDPPFNSGRTYDTIRAARSVEGHRHEAFVDAWHWTSETATLVRNLGDWLSAGSIEFVSGLIRTLGESDMAAYLTMMAPRLAAIHRVLRADGSAYVHCDPAASHYLKVLMDHIFGVENFRNEIVWKRTHAHSGSRRYGPIHDTILFYSKGPRYTWNPHFSDYSAAYIAEYFRQKDEHGHYQLITCNAPGDRTGTRAHYEWHGQLPPPGRHWAWKKEQMEEYERQGRIVHSSTGVPRLKRYTNDGPGVPLQDLWLDINRLDAHSDERMGYDTQKPLALLTRIVAASSNPDDVVLDPFCGSGTTAVAAELLGRQWVVMDRSLLACSIALSRIRQEANLGAVQLEGFPDDVVKARRLLRDQPTAFGLWATGLLATLPDRQGSNESVATGTGTLRGRAGTMDLLSWVPLRARVGVLAMPSRGRRLSKAGFVVCHQTSHSALIGALEQKFGVPMHQVSLESLVASPSRRLGVAPEVTRALTAT